MLSKGHYFDGAFFTGFLSTNDEVIPGNLGLKDQHVALKWVARNIRKFGGDPNRVTIGGQNAGGVSVSHHLLARPNRGLYSISVTRGIFNFYVSLSV